ncbi:hypothetical protein VOLCADRAFT_80309 [Volvox carteri f. nagariensis]|uniref:procollagen-proline 4-dioxygenase n=1 Tax=Volvox carteri f. nagariensis TaxID=3068 RepID=D8TQK0_VOLCA|nr:uncharacterized protein VOLCADRAFT_80309 [Volvox carteri f. nagariensis]EFJ50167.1 hypothetical protein VOLCADRAFT_80309 [Volvox carteri f. nagariensis]|eukprot:XP_002948787.1 hypothetical protein VOLCADRAFT_80309 [Volvox carteri f. nagariensis]
MEGQVLLLILALAVTTTPLSMAVEDVGRDLIGWLGETYRSGRTDVPDSRMVVLSWQPRVFLYKGILTQEECDYLIKIAQGRLERSGVSDATTGEGGVSDIRTSSGMFYTRGENDVVKRIETRLAMWTMLPVENGEGIQVLRYEKTQKYDPHHDYFSFEGRDANGGNRMATVLMYLATPEEGGETVFPKIPVPAGQTRANFSECGMKGLAVKPVKGDAVLFWSIRPDGRFEPGSLHGSCPVIRGVKWSATKWIHVGPYSMGAEKAVEVTRVIYAPPPPPAVPGCINTHKLCDHWAESGECESNPGYMVGQLGSPGACNLACNRCDLIAQH